jgi:ribosomal protein S12 methylthiotransferase
VIGRTYRDTPEVDGFVFVRGRAQVGEFATVRVTDALPYDVIGELVPS